MADGPASWAARRRRVRLSLLGTTLERFATWAAAIVAVCLFTTTLHAQDAAPQAGGGGEGAHYTIAVHVSGNGSRKEPRAIEEFVQHRVNEINAAGGILRRRLKVRVFDDRDEETETVKNMQETLQDPRLIGIVGVWSSSRGSFVADDVGKSGVPFISEMSVETLFTPYPNVYSLAHSVRDEVDVFLSLIRNKGIRRIAYVGFRDDLFTNAYLSHLIDETDGPHIVSTFWESPDTVLSDYDRAVAEIVENRAEAVVLALGSKLGARFLARLAAKGVAFPAFVSYGNIASVLASPEGGEAYQGALFEVSTGGVANLNNERIESLSRELGIRMRGDDTDASQPAYDARELGYGARYADLVQLMADAAAGRQPPGGPIAAASEPTDDSIEAVRARIASALSGLREGRQYYKGRAQYWTFSHERATSERAMLLWRSPGQPRAMLNPRQFLRIDGKMREVPVLFLHLDMVRMFEVDTNARRFDAEFYLTLRSQGDLPFEAIDFTNAYRSNTSAEPIKWREVATYDDDVAHGLGKRRVYHVTGRFAFDPDLAKYPFDEQLLTISFQPSDAKSFFILQPPGEELRQKAFRVEDWKLVNHYVGTTDRIITSVRGPRLDEHVVPYYNFNYTWVMRREVIDYLVRVIVPLSFILIVAYLSAFIPRREFNATIAIQVTALLSAIALYFALNQPNSDEVTLSDKIFVSAYAVVSLMIALSIFEIHEGPDDTAHDQVARGPHLTTLRAIQIYVVPVLTLLVIGWLIASAATDRSIAEGVRQLIRWGLLSFTDLIGR